MKKALISAIVLAGAVAGAAAQEQPATMANNGNETVETVTYGKHRVATNTFWHNWFVQAGAGAQISFTEHDRQCKIGDRISPALNIAVGKWFTPGIGVRLMYSGLYVKGATQGHGHRENYVHSTGEPVDGKYTWEHGFLEHQKFNYLNIHADVMFNLCQMLGGYNPKRTYSLIPYVGVGYAHVMSEPQANEITGNLGISNAFSLSDAWDLNLDVNCMLAHERFSGEDGHRTYDALLNATLGVTYKIPKRGWDKPVSTHRTLTAYDNSKVNELQEKLARQQAEMQGLKDALEEAKRTERVTKLIASGNIVFFDIDKWMITDKTRASLGFVAQSIKDSTVPFTVTGYADKGTGSPEWNETLSKNRAEAVRDVLVNEFGVPAEKLKVQYKGGVDDMFYNDPRCSRCVIVIPQE